MLHLSSNLGRRSMRHPALKLLARLTCEMHGMVRGKPPPRPALAWFGRGRRSITAQYTDCCFTRRPHDPLSASEPLRCPTARRHQELREEQSATYSSARLKGEQRQSDPRSCSAATCAKLGGASGRREPATRCWQFENLRRGLGFRVWGSRSSLHTDFAPTGPVRSRATSRCSSTWLLRH